MDKIKFAENVLDTTVRMTLKGVLAAPLIFGGTHFLNNTDNVINLGTQNIGGHEITIVKEDFNKNFDNQKLGGILMVSGGVLIGSSFNRKILTIESVDGNKPKIKKANSPKV